MSNDTGLGSSVKMFYGVGFLFKPFIQSNCKKVIIVMNIKKKSYEKIMAILT